MSPEGTEATIKGLISAWLQEHGADAQIPDLSGAFGYLTVEDRQELKFWFEGARNRVVGTVVFREADRRLSDTRISPN